MKASTMIVSTALVLGLLGLAHGQELKASGEPRNLLQDGNMLQADGEVALMEPEVHGKPRGLTTFDWHYPKTSYEYRKIAKWVVQYINADKKLRKQYLGSSKYTAGHYDVTNVKYYIDDHYKIYIITIKIKYGYPGNHRYVKTLIFKVKVVKDNDYYMYYGKRWVN